MNQRDLETLLLHQSLARMSDTPNLGGRARQLEKRFERQVYQAWRQERYGYSGEFDAMHVPF